MALQNLTEGKVLKYLAIFFTGLVIATVAIVLSLNSPGNFRDQLFERAIAPLLIIPPNEPDVLRVVYTGVSTPLTGHIAQQSVVISINNSNYVFDAGSRSTANFITQGTLEAAFIEKPFLTNIKEFNFLLLNKYKTIYQINYTRRFIPNFIKLKKYFSKKIIKE